MKIFSFVLWFCFLTDRSHKYYFQMLLHLFPRSVMTRNFTNLANCQIICISPVSREKHAGLRAGVLLGGLALIKSASARTFLRLQSRSRLLSLVSGLFPPSPSTLSVLRNSLITNPGTALSALVTAAVPVRSERQQRHFSSTFSAAATWCARVAPSPPGANPRLPPV